MEPSGKASAETQSSGSPREYVLKQDKAAQTTGQSRCLRAMGLGVLAAALQPSIPCAPPVTAGRSSAATSPGHGGRTSLFQQKEETVRTQKPLTPVPGVPELPSVSRQSQVSFKRESPFQKHEASTGYKSTQQKAVASTDCSVSSPPVLRVYRCSRIFGRRRQEVPEPAGEGPT